MAQAYDLTSKRHARKGKNCISVEFDYNDRYYRVYLTTNGQPQLIRRSKYIDKATEYLYRARVYGGEYIDK